MRRAWSFGLMTNVKHQMVHRLVEDTRGVTAIEYALIAGLIVIAAISAITSIGTKVLARWTSLNHSL